jgi:hypothetical protein
VTLAVPAAKEVSKSHWFLAVMAELIRLRPDQPPRNYLKYRGATAKPLLDSEAHTFNTLICFSERNSSSAFRRRIYEQEEASSKKRFEQRKKKV